MNWKGFGRIQGPIEIHYSSICLEQMRNLSSHVLRRKFGLHRQEVTSGWKKQLSEELCNLYTSSHTTATRNANTIFAGIPTGKGYLARSRCKWNILKWVRETGCTSVYSIRFAQERVPRRTLAKMAMNNVFSHY
jgi:hypothetical protein